MTSAAAATDIHADGPEGAHAATRAVTRLSVGVAVVLIAVFIGVFNKKFKWDQNEQFYLELKAREKREAENKDREV